MSPQLSLDDLLAKALAGDTKSLMSLLEALGPQVRQRIEPKISPHLRSSLDADDVMQITYVEAVMRLGRFNKGGGASGFLAWLSRLAENNLIDAIRSLEAAKRPDPSMRVVSHAGRAESMVALIDILGVTSTTPSVVAAKDEAASHLERALSSLPPDYEKVVRMYDLEGRPIADVAKTVGKSEGAAYMLRARAHDRLKELMGPSGNFFSTPG